MAESTKDDSTGIEASIDFRLNEALDQPNGPQHPLLVFILAKSSPEGFDIEPGWIKKVASRSNDSTYQLGMTAPLFAVTGLSGLGRLI